MSKNFSRKFGKQLASILSPDDYKKLLYDVKKYKEENAKHLSDAIGMYMAIAQRTKEIEPDGIGEYTREFKKFFGSTVTPDKFISTYAKQGYKIKQNENHEHAKVLLQSVKKRIDEEQARRKNAIDLGLELTNLLDKKKENLTKKDIQRIGDLLKMKHPSQINLNATDLKGETPLHKAARHDRAEVVQALIKAGVDVDVKNNFGETPLYCGARDGRIRIVQSLIKAGADIEATDRVGSTPLYVAAKNGETEIVQALLAAGADIEVKNKFGESLLFGAVANGKAGAVRDLIKAGVDIKVKDRDENTVLHRAARSGDVETLFVLLAAGADINVKNKEGKTPLHGAAECRNEEIVKALIEAGADVKAKNKDGKTAANLLEAFIEKNIIARRNVSKEKQVLELLKTAEGAKAGTTIDANASGAERTGTGTEAGSEGGETTTDAKPVRKRGRIKGKRKPSNSALKPNVAAAIKLVSVKVEERDGGAIPFERERRA